MILTKNKRGRKPGARLIVTKDGVDCGFAPAVEVGLSNLLANGHELVSSLIDRRGIIGVLVKNPEAPFVFDKRERAIFYVRKAIRVRRALKSTMADSMPKLAPALEDGNFAIRSFFPK